VLPHNHGHANTVAAPAEKIEPFVCEWEVPTAPVLFAFEVTIWLFRWMPNGLLDRWYERRSHTQESYAGIEKHGNRIRLPRQFATNANRRTASLLYRQPYQPDNGRVVVLVITLHQGILPASGHGMLRQVIGTQTKGIRELQDVRHR